MTLAVILLPWPDKRLSPNARLHFRAVAAVKAAARAEAGWCTLAAIRAARRAEMQGAPWLHVHLRFFPPDKRARDADNMVASMKAALDGIADALRVNDSRFRLSHAVEGVTKGGRVIVEVRAE